MKSLAIIFTLAFLCVNLHGDTPPTVLKVNGKIGNVVLTTTDISEGTNLYFTNARVYSALGSLYLKADGSIPLTSNWSLGSFQLKNLADPTSAQDAATKNYVDTHTGATVWGSITGTLSNQTDLQSALNGKEPTITAGTTSQYWRGDKTFQTLSTSVVPEGSNLYYTQARFDTAFAGKTTTNLTEGSNLYYTQARFDTAFAGKTTSSLTEGSNLYFTNARAQGAVSATSPLVDTAGVFSIPQATSSVSGYLSNTDWSTFNNKQSALTFGNLTDVGTDGLTVTGGTGAVIGSGTSLSQHVSDASHNGYLSSSDWTTFNNKLSKVTGNYITNPDAEIDTSGWNLYNDSGRTVPASVVNQDITYTSTLSGNAGNGATVSYTFCGSSYVGPIVTCPSGTAVQVCWYNGPSLAQNPTATVLKAAYDAQSCATAIATSAITGTASNLQYENGTTTLANGGDTSPVDGTGGVTAGVTFTRNTTTPLIGIASFDLGKDAANRQGQGVSTDFIINSVDKNSTLQVSFVYEGSSGMALGSASDAQVFVYDINNAVLIPVVPSNTLAGPVSTAKTFVGTFPTSSSSNYRLIIHIATTSAVAWDLLLDSVTVNNEVTPSVATQVPSVVLLAQPISNAVTDHMVVMWQDGSTKWVPATIAGGALPTFGDDKTQLGFATNIVGLEASIYIRGYMDGFSFGPFTGYQQYIDNTAGAISALPSPFNDMYVIVGTAISSTALNINFSPHVDAISNSSGVPVKGGLLTAGSVNDGTGDQVLAAGTTGQFLMYNTSATLGMAATTPVATAPIVYTASTHTFSCNVATGSVAGCLASADWTTFNNKAATASPTFTGTPSLPTGTTGVTQTAGNSTTALATTAFVTTADNLKANLASPTFTGTPSLPTGTTAVTQTAGNSTTAIATTAFATTADNLKANLASPTFTGTVTLPSSNLVNGASAATNASIVYKDSHIKSTMTTAPTSVVAAGAGTGATCTIAHASDSAGIITLTTGSVGTPSTGTQCTLTFNKAYSTIPVCVFSPANSNAGSNLVLFSVGTSTTAGQPFSFGVAGGTSTAYIYNYMCMETQ